MIKNMMFAGSLLAISAAPVFAGDMNKAEDMTVEPGMAMSFVEIDVNQDKKLTKDELTATGAAETSFDKFDSNKDGTIDEAEFVAISKKHK